MQQNIIEHQKTLWLLKSDSESDLRRQHECGHRLIINADRNQIITVDLLLNFLAMVRHSDIDRLACACLL
jgi:hypothetical protein